MALRARSKLDAAIRDDFSVEAALQGALHAKVPTILQKTG
ncbi:hypothetical protein B932_1818 [Gluconobacter oxydans H24]|nr:hypothetical protein B932_1818 [Gluconobacter oxydans H24]